MDAEIASALVTAYWQATGMSIAVVVLAIAAFSWLSFWSARHIDAKFDRQDAKQGEREARLQAQVDEIKGAVDRGTKEHEDWRKEMRSMNDKWSTEMKAINEKVTEQEIERRVTQRLQEQQP